MSFNQQGPFANDLESDAADARSNNYKDFPEFDSLSQALDNNLYNINNNQFVSLKNLLQQYESLLNDYDTTEISSPSTQQSNHASKLSLRISELFKKTNDSFKNLNKTTNQLNEYLNECENNHEDEDTLRYLRQKESILIKLIKSSINQFRKYQKKYESLQQSYINKIGQVRNSALNDETNASGVPEQQQEQQQVSAQVQITYEPINAEELEQQSLMIQEREREIHQITQDTTEINEIFQNLQDIIHEQQFSIDNIEGNIINYANNTHGASNELRRAERYQRRAGGRMFCCLLILIGVLGSIVFIGLVF